ncbi:HPr(Ser) kinase/phosphatase [Myxococcota bacterium]
MTVYDPPLMSAKPISVRALLEDPGLGLVLHLVAGEAGLEREVRHPRIQKSGLAMVGHREGIVPSRIQVLGGTELSYAESLGPAEQAVAARHLFSLCLACVVVTRGVSPPLAFVAEAERTGTPLIVCQERSSSAITAFHTLLDERLAPRVRIHGVLVDVFEIGVLLLGRSGIGKSEIALELVMRGHRLVADDVVEFEYRPPGLVLGEAAALLRHHMEVRGLGILNIMDLYGVTAVRERKQLDLVVQMELWEEGLEYDRIGVEDHHKEILGVPIREVRLPVRPGRNMSSIVEIAARNELLRKSGYDSARKFIERVDAAIEHGGIEPPPPSSLPQVHPPMAWSEGGSLPTTRRGT